MKKISSIVTNYDTATSGFSEGKLRDNPGDDTGSSVVAALGNDWYYALAAVVKAQNSLGAVSDNPESENNHDFLDALLEMVGQKVNGVSDWSAATTYSTANTHVMRAGIQFTNINTTGNTNQDPLTTDGYWMPCPDVHTLFSAWKEGRVVSGGSAPIHDFNNATYYKQYFSLGKHRVGGYGGSVFEAYGVHLDGSGVGSGDLSAIIETWSLKNTWAPGSTGARTLVDVRGRVMRFIEATGGRADLIGEVLADQMQGHWHDLYPATGGSGGTTVWQTVSATQTGVSSAFQTSDKAGAARSDGVNGTPRTGNVTADKSVTVGVPYAVIMVPA
jgi:hypothetical protein